MVDFMENPNYRGMISDDLGVPPILGNRPIWAMFIAAIYVEIGDGLFLFYYIYIYTIPIYSMVLVCLPT
jgi:hypothetical protein